MKKILAIILIFALSILSGCGDKVYYDCAGNYELVSVESDSAVFTDFAYADFELSSSGEYSFNYKLSNTVGIMKGNYTLSESVINFSGAISGTAQYSAGYFTLSFNVGLISMTATFALTV